MVEWYEPDVNDTNSIFFIKPKFCEIHIRRSHIKSPGCLSMVAKAIKNHIIVASWWVRWRLKSSASRLFTQAFIQAQIKENIKAPRYWPLWGEFTGDWWIPRTKGQ